MALCSGMDVDYSVELGADDDVLEFPWVSPDESLRFFDLKRQPEQLVFVEEAMRFRELGEFLAVVNSSSTFLMTAKCDAWIEDQLSESEDIYGAAMKFGSYVDLLLDDTSGERRFDFEEHEKLAARLTALLSKAPEIAAAVEFIVRRCYYHSSEEAVRPGYYLTSYVFGYGDDVEEARQRWGIALNLVQNVFAQLSCEVRNAPK